MFNGEDALDHKSRKIIYNYISSHPGVSFGGIRNFMDMNDSTLKYHLIYLERTKRISSRREGRRRCYFCNNGSKFEYRQYPGAELDTLNRNQKHVLNVIRTSPGISKKGLINKTKLNRKTIGYTIDRLLEQKLIWKVKSEGEIGYEYITKEKLRGEIYNRLLMKLLADEIDEETFMKIKGKLEMMDIDEIEL